MRKFVIHGAHAAKRGQTIEVMADTYHIQVVEGGMIFVIFGINDGTSKVPSLFGSEAELPKSIVHNSYTMRRKFHIEEVKAPDPVAAAMEFLTGTREG